MKEWQAPAGWNQPSITLYVTFADHANETEDQVFGNELLTKETIDAAFRAGVMAERFRDRPIVSIAVYDRERGSVIKFAGMCLLPRSSKTVCYSWREDPATSAGKPWGGNDTPPNK